MRKKLRRSNVGYIFGVRSACGARFFNPEKGELIMYNKNDNSIQTARVGIDVLTVFLCLACIAGSVYLIIFGETALGILLLFAGLGLIWVGWIFIRLVIDFFTDIKLIRNKLYGENNDALDRFYDIGPKDE